METGVIIFGIAKGPTLVARRKSGEGEGLLKTDALESLHTINSPINDPINDVAKKKPDSHHKLPLKPLLIVSGLTLTVLAYHLYLTQNPTDSAPTSAKASPVKVADKRATASEINSAATSPSKTTPPPRAAFDNDTKAVILSCTRDVRALSGVHGPKEFMNLREYLEKAVQAPGHAPAETRLTARRLRLIDQNGRRLRLHVLPKSSAGDGFEIKLFGFNEDNLPIRLPLTEEMQSSNIYEIIDRFKARGQVELDEVSETMVWDTKTSANVLRQNSKIVSLHLNFPNGELNCRTTEGETDSVSCICL